jgi:radical SAM protein with 4Fe4S-binding SPASM domain
MRTKLPEVERIFLELTNICNFNCEFCPTRVSRRKRQQMDISLCKKAVDEISRENITDTVNFHLLGEPLLHPKITDAIKYAKSKGLNTELITNGALLDSRMTKRIIATKLDRLIISIVSLEKKDHAFRKCRMDFNRYYKRIIGAVKQIKESAPKMTVLLSLVDTSSKRFFEVDKKFEMNEERDEFKENLMPIIGDMLSSVNKKVSKKRIRDAIDKLKFSYADYQKIIWIDKNKRIGIVIKSFVDWGNAFTKKKIYPAKIGFCGAAFTNPGVLSDGRVVLCCGDYDGKTSLGNLRSDSLAHILNSRRSQHIADSFRRFRITHPYCQRCLGSTSRIKAFGKGLLTIYLFKCRSPTKEKEISLF